MWLPSNIIFVRAMHVVWAFVVHFHYCKIIHRLPHNVCFHFSVDAHLGCSKSGVIINTVAMCILIHDFWWMCICISAGFISIVEILRQRECKCWASVNIAREFSNWLYQFVLPPEGMKVPVVLHICQYLVLSLFYFKTMQLKKYGIALWFLFSLLWWLTKSNIWSTLY